MRVLVTGGASGLGKAIVTELACTATKSGLPIAEAKGPRERS